MNVVLDCMKRQKSIQAIWKNYPNMWFRTHVFLRANCKETINESGGSPREGIKTLRGNCVRVRRQGWHLSREQNQSHWVSVKRRQTSVQQTDSPELELYRSAVSHLVHRARLSPHIQGETTQIIPTTGDIRLEAGWPPTKDAVHGVTLLRRRAQLNDLEGSFLDLGVYTVN